MRCPKLKSPTPRAATEIAQVNQCSSPPGKGQVPLLLMGQGVFLALYQRISGTYPFSARFPPPTSPCITSGETQSEFTPPHLNSHPHSHLTSHIVLLLHASLLPSSGCVCRGSTFTYVLYTTPSVTSLQSVLCVCGVCGVLWPVVWGTSLVYELCTRLVRC